MKKRFTAYALAALAALSCSSMRELQTQTYDDGIYTRPTAPSAQTVVTEEEVDNLLAESHQSPVYIINGGDTLVVPPGKSVRLKTDDQVITVTDDLPDWAWGYSYMYRPWYLRGYYGTSWYYSPWYYSPYPYYSYYWGFYYPWYYDSWYYNPWYYDYWYSPFWRSHLYGYWPHHYYGYYGHTGGHRPWNPNGRAWNTGRREGHFASRGGAVHPSVIPGGRVSAVSPSRSLSAGRAASSAGVSRSSSASRSTATRASGTGTRSVSAARSASATRSASSVSARKPSRSTTSPRPSITCLCLHMSTRKPCISS